MLLILSSFHFLYLYIFLPLTFVLYGDMYSFLQASVTNVSLLVVFGIFYNYKVNLLFYSISYSILDYKFYISNLYSEFSLTNFLPYSSSFLSLSVRSLQFFYNSNLSAYFYCFFFITSADIDYYDVSCSYRVI